MHSSIANMYPPQLRNSQNEFAQKIWLALVHYYHVAIESARATPEVLRLLFNGMIWTVDDVYAPDSSFYKFMPVESNTNYPDLSLDWSLFCPKGLGPSPDSLNLSAVGYHDTVPEKVCLASERFHGAAFPALSLICMIAVCFKFLFPGPRKSIRLVPNTTEATEQTMVAVNTTVVSQDVLEDVSDDLEKKANERKQAKEHKKTLKLLNKRIAELEAIDANNKALIDSSSQKNSQLEIENSRMTKENSTWSTEKADLVSKNKALTVEKTELFTKNEERKKTMHEYTTALGKKNSKVAEDKVKYETKLAAKDQVIDSQKTELSEVKKEIKSSTAQVNTLQADAKMMSIAQSENVLSLEAENKNLRAEVEKVTTEKKKLATDNKSLEKTVQQQTSEAADLNKENQGLKQTNANLATTNKSTTAEKVHLHTKNHILTSEAKTLKEQKKSLEEAVTTLKQDVSAIQEEKANTDSKYTALEVSNTTLQQSHNSLELANNSLKYQLTQATQGVHTSALEATNDFCTDQATKTDHTSPYPFVESDPVSTHDDAIARQDEIHEIITYNVFPTSYPLFNSIMLGVQRKPRVPDRVKRQRRAEHKERMKGIPWTGEPGMEPHYGESDDGDEIEVDAGVE